MEEQFYRLLSLKLSGDITPADLALLRELLISNKELQFLHDQMIKIHADPKEEEDAEQAFAAHSVKMQLQGKFDSLKKANEFESMIKPAIKDRLPMFGVRKPALIFLAAAFTFIGVFIFYHWLQLKNTSALKPLQCEISTKKGSKSIIKLPDGTNVWLNADSKLFLLQNFAGKNREVALEGEAYFDVAHDTTRPFIIHAGNTNISVLGTSFNVRNYPGEGTTETTLIRGKIEVSFTNRPGERIILKPMEKLIITKEGNKEKDDNQAISAPAGDRFIRTKVAYSGSDSSLKETSWLTGKLVFNNELLENIAQQLERHFSIHIIFQKEDVKKFRYTGAFEDATVEKVLRIIQLSKRIDYTQKGDTILIK